MLEHGLLGLSGWQTLAYTLIVTHITIVGVTVYLHRFSAHRALDMHPALQHFFRFWIWSTTAMLTKDWTSIHRKHHAKCETEEDPHSPVKKGLWTVLSRGAELYAEAKDPETLERYGKGTPDDWLERKVYSRFPIGGVLFTLVLNMLLLGPIGITVWVITQVTVTLILRMHLPISCRGASSLVVKNYTTTTTLIQIQPNSR
jgi:stearoyl-CoA desaturase (Delta-9 desaturase)